MLVRVLEVLCQLMERRIYAVAHKVDRFQEIKWYGKLYSGSSMRNDKVHAQRLTDLTRPLATGRVENFLRAVDRMGTNFPPLAEVGESLRDLPEIYL